MSWYENKLTLYPNLLYYASSSFISIQFFLAWEYWIFPPSTKMTLSPFGENLNCYSKSNVKDLGYFDVDEHAHFEEWMCEDNYWCWEIHHKVLMLASSTTTCIGDVRDHTK